MVMDAQPLLVAPMRYRSLNVTDIVNYGYLTGALGKQLLSSAECGNLL